MSDLSRRLLPSTAALAAFDSVARLGSFSGAAEELSLTQGAVSRQVSGLEQQLGVILFDRTSRGAVLTTAGVDYALAVREALGRIRSASLDAMSNRHGDTLNLAIPPTFGTRWLMPRIPRFVTRHPEVTLNFATRIGTFDFGREGIDMAIHVGAIHVGAIHAGAVHGGAMHGGVFAGDVPPRVGSLMQQPDWPGTEATFLMGEQVVPVAAPAFLAARPIRQAADLLRQPLLHMASRPGAWRHWFAKAGIEADPSQAMRFEQFGSVAQAAIAGLGVALMPTFLIDTELASGHLVEALPQRIDSPSAYYAVAPLGRRDFRPVLAFRAWLIEEIGRYRDEVVGW